MNTIVIYSNDGKDVSDTLLVVEGDKEVNGENGTPVVVVGEWTEAGFVLWDGVLEGISVFARGLELGARLGATKLGERLGATKLGVRLGARLGARLNDEMSIISNRWNFVVFEQSLKNK